MKKAIKMVCLTLILMIFCGTQVFAINTTGKYYYVRMNGVLHKVSIPNSVSNNSNNSCSNNTTSGTSFLKDTIFYCNTTLSASITINDTIKRKAKELTQYYKSDYCRALMLYNFVKDHIKYDNARATYITTHQNMCGWEAGAQYGYNTKSGVCFEYATLFAAMARSIGLKTRIEYTKNHIWNEVYDSTSKKWMFIDCTWKLFNADIKKYQTNYTVIELLS